MPPKLPDLPPEPLDAIEEAAGDWLVLKAEGFNPQQAQDFSRWLALDPRHREVFQALESTWEKMGEARPNVTITTPSAVAVEMPASSGLVRYRTWIRGGIAAAAVLAVGLFVWNTVGRSPSIVVTDVGGLQRLDLPDGSVVWLNTDSQLEVGFTAAERRVTLARGEAHFEVAKDKAHPFIVSASGVNVQAVGTAFNVRLRAETVDVLVTEGRVKVAQQAAPASRNETRPSASVEIAELGAGERTVVPLVAATTPPEVQTVADVDMKKALAWQERRLDFESTPLTEIVAEINRYNRHQLIIDDPRLRDRRFGGSFPSGDYNAFVRLLENNFGVIADRRDQETHLHLP